MPEPLVVTRRELDLKLRELPPQFRSVLGHPPRESLAFRSMANAGGLNSYALVGRDEDSAIDLRDGEKPVIPIGGTERRFYLAIGFDWRMTPSRSLRFVRLQLLVFLRTRMGGSGVSERDLNVRQALRLEWEGTSADGSFEAADAAHPHWQVDVLSDPGPLNISSSFGTAIDLHEAQAASEIDDNAWLQRTHLAALTDWDGDSWPGPFREGRHARPPRSLEGLTSWMLSACAYVQQELRR